MGVLVVFVAGGGLRILNSRQPHQSLLINVNPQWIDAHERHINSQVEFVAVEEQGVVDVFANDTTLLQRRHILKIIRQKYALSLRAGAGLHNIIPIRITLHCLLQLRQLMRQHEGLRHEIVVLGAVLFSHAGEMAVQAVFSGYFGGFGPMIDFLKLP